MLCSIKILSVNQESYPQIYYYRLLIGFAMNGKSEYDTPSYDHLR